LDTYFYTFWGYAVDTHTGDSAALTQTSRPRRSGAAHVLALIGCSILQHPVNIYPSSALSYPRDATEQVKRSISITTALDKRVKQIKQSGNMLHH